MQIACVCKLALLDQADGWSEPSPSDPSCLRLLADICMYIYIDISYVARIILSCAVCLSSSIVFGVCSQLVLLGIMLPESSGIRRGPMGAFPAFVAMADGQMVVQSSSRQHNIGDPFRSGAHRCKGDQISIRA